MEQTQVADNNDAALVSPVPPSVGRIVHYVPRPGQPETRNNAEVVPAIIVRVWENGLLNLKCFCDGPWDNWQPSVPYNAIPIPGTWHWPPRT